MTAELRRGITLAILGLLIGLVLVAGLLGDGRTALNRLTQAWRSGAPTASAPVGPASGETAPGTAPSVESERRQAAASSGSDPASAPTAGPGTARTNAAQAPPKAEGAPDEAKAAAPRSAANTANADGAKPSVTRADAGKPEGGRSEGVKSETGKPEVRTAAAASGRTAAAPSFDVIRVEPTGEAVVAGRGAPGATIEMLRGGEPFARTLADGTGLFAIVPPALPKGTNEITLRMIAPDGARATSKDTAVIVVPQGGSTKPLIALTSPDKPTVVLSQPETAVAARPETVPAPTPGAKPPAQTPVKVVSVDAESGGRLFVTAQAPPGATVRLYLNDTLVAPAGAGQDGRVAFAIGRGVQAGQYRVRIDQVDPVSGEVRNRSEVPFTFPTALAGAPAVAGATTMSRSPEAEALVGKRVADLARQQEHVPQPPAAAAPSPQASAPAADAQRDVATAAPPSVGAKPAAPAAAPGARIYVPELATTMVSRGDNLWSISRKSYGRGARYTVIYDANQDQIRNPSLIYPGQIFVMPQGGEGHQAEKR